MCEEYFSELESFNQFSINMEENNKLQYQKLGLFKSDSF